MSLFRKVVVLTGASSGLGRAAALELARRGARLVITGRNPETLEDTARRCRALGAEVVVVAADVTSEADVGAVVERALDLGGGIDVWVNNAGVTVFGALESTPMTDLRRVVETNLWGAVFGARAVLPVFRQQGHGVLINVGSILSKVGQPLVPAYVISKFAVRGLSEALRAELANQPHIQVCTLLPYAIDTPHFQEGANMVGLKAYAMPPVQSPEKVARALADLAERPRRELHVPRMAVLGLALHTLFPQTIERVIFDVVQRWHVGGSQRVDAAGNLWQPSSKQLGAHGDRPPQIGMVGLVGWLMGHYAGRALRALATG